MNEQEVKKLFLEGYNAYNNNQPEPTPSTTEEKVKRLGWKLGERHAISMELSMDNAMVAFMERSKD